MSSCSSGCHGLPLSERPRLLSILQMSFWLFCNAQVVDTYTPILLSIEDFDRLEIYPRKSEYYTIRYKTGLKSAITRLRGHPFTRRNSHISCFLTAVELRRLHRRFGNCSTNNLMKFLERSERTDTGPKTRKLLQDTERRCEFCQNYAWKLQRFGFIPIGGKECSHTIYADMFYIEGKTVLHVVNEATNLRSAELLQDMSFTAI